MKDAQLHGVVLQLRLAGNPASKRDHHVLVAKSRPSRSHQLLVRCTGNGLRFYSQRDVLSPPTPKLRDACRPPRLPLIEQREHEFDLRSELPFTVFALQPSPHFKIRNERRDVGQTHPASVRLDVVPQSFESETCLRGQGGDIGGSELGFRYLVQARRQAPCCLPVGEPHEPIESLAVLHERCRGRFAVEARLFKLRLLVQEVERADVSGFAKALRSQVAGLTGL